jgi:hypothetical protein
VTQKYETPTALINLGTSQRASVFNRQIGTYKARETATLEQTKKRKKGEQAFNKEFPNRLTRGDSGSKGSHKN